VRSQESEDSISVNIGKKLNKIIQLGGRVLRLWSDCSTLTPDPSPLTPKKNDKRKI